MENTPDSSNSSINQNYLTYYEEREPQFSASCCETENSEPCSYYQESKEVHNVGEIRGTTTENPQETSAVQNTEIFYGYEGSTGISFPTSVAFPYCKSSDHNNLVSELSYLPSGSNYLHNGSYVKVMETPNSLLNYSNGFYFHQNIPCENFTTFKPFDYYVENRRGIENLSNSRSDSMSSHIGTQCPQLPSIDVDLTPVSILTYMSTNELISRSKFSPHICRNFHFNEPANIVNYELEPRGNGICNLCPCREKNDPIDSDYVQPVFYNSFPNFGINSVATANETYSEILRVETLSPISSIQCLFDDDSTTESCLEITSVNSSGSDIKPCKENDRSNGSNYPTIKTERKCMICAEIVMKKQRKKERMYGLLENCNHIFCLRCLYLYQGVNKTLYKPSSVTFVSCPECKNLSDFIIPTRFASKKSKMRLIKAFKTFIKNNIPCKSFDKGKGYCRGGYYCHFLHEDSSEWQQKYRRNNFKG